MVSKLNLKLKVFKSQGFRIALLIVLTTAFVISTAGLVYSYSVPSATREVYTYVKVSQKFSVDYVAYVKESLIYDNRTVITSREPVYFKLLKGLNVTYTYVLTSETPIKNVRGSYTVTLALNTTSWSKTFTIAGGDLSEVLNKTNYLYINFTELFDYISKVDKEVGGSSKTYDIIYYFSFKPTITAVVNDSKTLTYQLSLTPKVKVSYEVGKSVIDFIVQDTEKEFKDTYELINPTYVRVFGLTLDLNVFRLASMTSSFICSGLIAFIAITSTISSSREKPLVDKLINKYKDIIIASTSDEIGTTQASRKVVLTDFKDMVKVATIRKKPIIKVSNEAGSNVRFILVDDDVIYEYIPSEESFKIQK